MEARRRQPVSPARRRRLVRRGAPLVVLAAASFGAGAVVGSGSQLEDAASRFADAWAREDYAAMHAELNDTARSRYSANEFARIYVRADRVATIASLGPGDPREAGERGGADVVRVPLEIGTRAFGDLRGEVALPFRDGGVAWEPHLVFPGVQPGERLDRRVTVPPRAPILARDGTPLAEGPSAARTSPLGAAAQDVVGAVGPADPAAAADQIEAGFPAEALAGVSGLEQAFNARLAGQPGGQLIAVDSVPRRGGESDETASESGHLLATGAPRDGEPVKTTIDPDLQQAAVTALGGRAGGVAALDAGDGSVRAVAGAAFSAPQPPGSTFKIVTTTAALEDGDVKLNDVFPYVTGIDVGGREIANAHDESCGGTFVQAFARSCNSVFAPLGPKIGEQRLVEMAERFGFNSPPALYNRQATEITDPPESSIPQDIPTDLDLGVSAIGQGQVLATPLELATISQTIATGGVRHPTSIVTNVGLGPEAEPFRVTSPRIAGTIRDLMEGVVTSGTGAAAALPGVKVAGKTGTAELGPKAGQGPLGRGEKPEQEVDAWFTAFAPSNRPRIAVAVMIINAEGDGGAVAAPIAREVMAAALD